MCVVYAMARIGGWILNLMQTKIPCRWKGKWRKIGPLLGPIKIPDVVGMVIFGLICRNMSSWTRDSFNPVWASYAETTTLLIILIRGSLELEFKGALFKIGLLASFPHLIEMAFNFILMWTALDMPPFVAISFALSMTAVAPAVVVPLMI